MLLKKYQDGAKVSVRDKKQDTFNRIIELRKDIAEDYRERSRKGKWLTKKDLAQKKKWQTSERKRLKGDNTLPELEEYFKGVRATRAGKGKHQGRLTTPQPKKEMYQKGGKVLKKYTDKMPHGAMIMERGEVFKGKKQIKPKYKKATLLKVSKEHAKADSAYKANKARLDSLAKQDSVKFGQLMENVEKMGISPALKKLKN